ncbi:MULTISPECIES: hypothetical protein [Gordonia]|uniref:hypothetical protein n=1 Tax=Gordonia TaxID=2053 RepID=UPI000AB09644|nr:MULTISPECIES: hypothetical protein [Gordonia]
MRPRLAEARWVRQKLAEGPSGGAQRAAGVETALISTSSISGGALDQRVHLRWLSRPRA